MELVQVIKTNTKIYTACKGMNLFCCCWISFIISYIQDMFITLTNYMKSMKDCEREEMYVESGYNPSDWY